MKEFANKDGSIVTLKLGEELHEVLGVYACEHGLKSAWVEGLGGASSLTLGFYNLETKQYQWKESNELHEILSLKGNLSWVDSEPFWHIHGAFSDSNYQVVGGHVKELVVSATCELYITPLETPLTRIFDDETGLKLLSESK